MPAYNFLFNKLEDLSDACCGKVRRRRNAVTASRGAPVTATATASKDDVLINAIQEACNKLRNSYRKTWAGMYAISVILDPRLFLTVYSEMMRRFP